MTMQRPLPQHCPECGSTATIERAGIVVCCVCPAGRRQADQANQAAAKLRKKAGVKPRRPFWARSRGGRRTPAKRK
jgi:uncharacterized Zn finger protein (UPF0148 family)